MKFPTKLLTNKYLFILSIIFLVTILTAINNYYFYDHVSESSKRNAKQLKMLLENEIQYCRNNSVISAKSCRENIRNLVRAFSEKAYYNDAIILKFENHNRGNFDWEKQKNDWDKVVASSIEIIIPKIKNNNKKIYYYSRVDFNKLLYLSSIFRSMTFSIFDKGQKLFKNADATKEEKLKYENLKQKMENYANFFKDKEKKEEFYRLLKEKYMHTISPDNLIKLDKLNKDIDNYKLSKKEWNLYTKLKQKISPSEISKIEWDVIKKRSRPAIGFAIFTIILMWLFRKREQSIQKVQKELEQEKKNREILETTFDVTEDHDDIKLYEAIMSNDITKLQEVKLIHPTMNILKFNAMIEHTEDEKLERLKILIEKGVDLNFKDNDGMTVLMYYALGNVKNDKNSKIIEFLLGKELDIDAQNKSGMTALMLCAMKNRPASVQILINNGADINIKQDLTAKELAATKEIGDMIAKVENHFPRQLATILRKFNEDDNPFKPTAHGWDFEFTEGYGWDFEFMEEYGNFKTFMIAAKKQWNEIGQELYKLRPNLYKKINNFLFADANTIENWCSKNEDRLAIGWSSLDGLEKWCNEGNDPFKFRLSKTYTVDGKDIQLFGDIIKLFKQEIQIRRESDFLKNIFIKKEDDLDYEYDFALINLEGKQFYTDTESFQKAMNIIFQQFQDNSEFKNITIEIVDDEKGQYYDLKITQHGSFANINALQLLEKSNGGNFSSIKRTLKNLCDWSVESCYNDECFRVNILKSSNIKDIEQLDYKVQGFTHIMRFYL